MITFTHQSLLDLLEHLLHTGVTSSSTDPTQAILITSLNAGLEKVSNEFFPQELLDTTQSVSTVVGTISYTVPVTLRQVTDVYVPTSVNKWKRCAPKTLSNLNDPSSQFDTNTGIPSFYDIKGDKIYFDKAYDAVYASGIKVHGYTMPTAITSANLASNCSLGTAYKQLIVYEAAIFFYHYDADEANYKKFANMCFTEKANVRLATSNGLGRTAGLDTRFFKYGDK
jgi:hypothetical protein